MSMRTLLSLTALFVLMYLPGCHCCSWTEHYADTIDDFADHGDFKKKLDDGYCEKLDATRWCMNRRCMPGHGSRCR